MRPANLTRQDVERSKALDAAAEARRECQRRQDRAGYLCRTCHGPDGYHTSECNRHPADECRALSPSECHHPDVREGRRNFARTIAALALYDAADAECDRNLIDWPLDVGTAKLRELERLAEKVGIAFGLDTADINNPETCRQCVRPGAAVPPPGFEEAFVRRAVRVHHDPTIPPVTRPADPVPSPSPTR
jgi:hypothetical protein